MAAAQTVDELLATADALRRRGRFAEAADALGAVLDRQPAHAWAHNLLGLTFADVGDFARASESLRRALAIRGDFPEAENNLARVLNATWQTSAAIDVLRGVTRRHPEGLAALGNLASLLVTVGAADEAVAAYRAALAAGAGARVHSNLLLALHYLPNIPAREIFAEHVAWGERHAKPLAPPPPRRPLAGRRLRVGYVSAAFARHPVAYFLEPILASHDRAAIDVVCYADVRTPDDATQRFEAQGHAWRDTAGLPDDALARLITDDAIDVLVDLAGHTERNRLLAFARQPAPVQVTYLGYPDTTGVPAIGYRVTDAIADPPGEADALHTEKLIRLPGGFLCYRPPADAPPVTARTGAGPVFGSFNKLAKVNASVVALWSRLLRETPSSRLLLKDACLADAGVRRSVTERFGACGVDASRVQLLGRQPAMTQHLDLYGGVDVALDPFPYNGTTTTCDALWMGVPVVTLAGTTHVARVGASVLTGAGRTEWIAQDADDYVRIAKALATDPARLANLRTTMRGELIRSGLCDAARLTRELESAFFEMCRA